MGKFKAMDIEQKEEAVERAFRAWENDEDIDFDQVMEEMYEKNILQGAAELCRRGDYGYAKFIDELQKELVDGIKKGQTPS